jgi:hypothetical protein
MAISAEQLNIILSAKDKEFTRAMDRSQKRVERFAKQSNKSLGSASKAFGKMGAAAAALLPALSAAALVSSIKRVTASMDDIGKTADQIGITTDALQELRTVAESSGVTQEELDKSIEKLGKGLAEAAMGIGTAKYALEALNLSADDLMALGLEDALGAIADEVNKIEDPMQKTALATQLFGRSGAPMLNLLREGADGMAEMRKEARKLGVVIDEDLIRNAEAAQDQLDLMSRVIGAQLSSALINLAPLLVSAATGIADITRMASAFFRTSTSGGVTGNLKQQLIDYEHHIEEFGRLQQQKDILEGIYAKARELDVDPNQNEIFKQKKKIVEAEAKLLEARAKRAKQLAATGKVSSLKSTLQSEMEENQGLADSYNMTAEAIERMRIAKEKSSKREAFQTQIAASGISDPQELQILMSHVDNLMDRWEETEAAASRVLNPLQQMAPVVADTRTELEKMIEKMLEASPALVDLGFDAEKLHSVMQTVESSMESAFMSMVDGTVSAKDAFRSMAADIIKQLYKVLVVEQMVNSISGGIKGAFGAPSGGGGGKASGGAVQAGRPYITGEHGRELFVPSSAGRVLSVSQSKAAVGGGDSVIVNQTINITTGVQQTVRTEIKTLMPQIANAAKSAVADAKRRGGAYGRALS